MGISSIHTGINEMKDFVRAPDNPFGGELVEKTSGPLGLLDVPSHVSGPLDNYETWVWEDINVSGPEAANPIIFDSWILGGGRNSTFARKHFYDLHLTRSAVESVLGLEEYSLSLRNLLESEGKKGILEFARPLGITPLADLFKGKEEEEEGKVF